MTAPSFEELVAAWQTGTIDEADLRAMEQRLLTDPAAQRYFATQCRQEMMLHQVIDMNRHCAVGSGTSALLRAEGTAALPADQHRTITRSHRRRRAARRRGTQATRPVVLFAVAAALLLGILGWLSVAATQRQVPAAVPVATQHGATQHNVRPQPRVVPAQAALAQVVVGVGLAQRGDASVELAAGTALFAGDVLSGDGLVIRSTDGSRFVFDGVVELAAADGLRLRLHGLANLDAEVSKQALGKRVRVRSEHGVCTVVGTAFNVRSWADETRLAVSEGVVEAAAHAGGMLSVAAEQAVVMDANGARYLDLAIQPSSGDTLIAGFTLYDAKSGAVVPGFEKLQSGMVIDRASLGIRSFNIRVHAQREVAAILAHYDGRDRLEQYLPFSVPGDDRFTGELMSWRPDPGRFQIVVEPFRDFAGHHSMGPAVTLALEIR
ncbi:MAG: hypothetical protein PF961_07315 [Planctomycetota bacterium]|jgi:ferric-dicitrate binding protein FerR (iron transport regulator)|nr:hypothetical protein [Planctomycetota bacterium]